VSVVSSSGSPRPHSRAERPRPGWASPLRWLAAVLLVHASAGCAGRSQVAPRAEGAADAPPHGTVDEGVVRGRATYYADSLAGRRTASGQPYDPRQLTAAHRTLPFGTEIEVSRPDGRAVRVRVNDRGPFGRAAARGVVVDLSRAAAEKLGMVREGVVDVVLRVLTLPPPRRHGRR
jgi:rare lipoprotein A